MSEKQIDGLSACIIGAGGYVGGELLRILAAHPRFARLVPVSESRSGCHVADVHPGLRGRLDATFVAAPEEPGSANVVFFAVPPRVAMEKAAAHLDAGSVVVDCSPDFRIKDLSVWERHYGADHASPQLVAEAAYGLVELNRDALSGARLIAAPGCYATVMQLATAPVAKALAEVGCEHLTVIADCASGTSGAGRRPDRPELLMSEAGGNYSAYALDGHRHEPEITEGIKAYAGLEPTLVFVPHLLPLPRGMFATVHFLPEREVDIDLGKVLADAYDDEQLIDVLPVATSPQVAAVVGTNRCQLGCAKGSLTVLGAIDNLGKGAAGQAVQAYNVAAGRPELEGLDG